MFTGRRSKFASRNVPRPRERSSPLPSSRRRHFLTRVAWHIRRRSRPSCCVRAELKMAPGQPSTETSPCCARLQLAPTGSGIKTIVSATEPVIAAAPSALTTQLQADPAEGESGKPSQTVGIETSHRLPTAACARSLWRAACSARDLSPQPAAHHVPVDTLPPNPIAHLHSPRHLRNRFCIEASAYIDSRRASVRDIYIGSSSRNAAPKRAKHRLSSKKQRQRRRGRPTQRLCIEHSTNTPCPVEAIRTRSALARVLVAGVSARLFAAEEARRSHWSLSANQDARERRAQCTTSHHSLRMWSRRTRRGGGPGRMQIARHRSQSVLWATATLRIQ